MNASPSSLLPREEVLFEGHPAVLPGLGSLLLVVLTVGLAWLVYWARSRATSYKVTTRRVIIERGLLSKRLEQVDTYRIKDYIVERPLGQRLLGTGNLQLVTSDGSTPMVELRGVRTDVMELYERLRQASDSERSARGVKLVEGG
jgi:uncharacterized membrane protein YdbT with pleckstrin-like domain